MRRNVEVAVFAMVVALVLAATLGLGSVEASQYRVIDPLAGAAIIDINTTFWEWSAGVACNPVGTFAIDGTGLRLQGNLSQLGREQKWAFRGDFRISIFASASFSRSHVALFEYAGLDPGSTLLAIHGYDGGGSPSVGLNGVAWHFGGTAYFLFKKTGGTLTIHRGDAFGVSEASEVVASGAVGPSSFFTIVPGVGCPPDGDLLIRDFVLEADQLVARNTTLATPPAEWLIATAAAEQCELDLAAAQTTIGSLTTQVATANATIASQAAQIQSLDTQLSAANVTIASQAAQIQALDAQLSIANGTIASQTAQIQDLQSQLVAANTIAGVQAARIAALEADLSTANATIAAHETTIDSLVALVFGGTADEPAAVAARDAAGEEIARAAAVVGTGGTRLAVAQRNFDAGVTALAAGDYRRAVVHFGIAFNIANRLA